MEVKISTGLPQCGNVPAMWNRQRKSSTVLGVAQTVTPAMALGMALTRVLATVRATVLALGLALTGLGFLAGCSGSSSPTAPANDLQACLVRAIFGDPAASPYVLPYPVGQAWEVTQSYCNPSGGHQGTFAYDFALPMGSPITTSRPGEVIIANDQFSDSDHTEGNENNVFVEHDDGSVVRYTHLQQGSVVVAVGDRVSQGQMLGSNGASGNTGGFPHLHFEVFRSRNFAKANAVPVNYSNAGGPLDERGGLRAGVVYQALPF